MFRNETTHGRMGCSPISRPRALETAVLLLGLILFGFVLVENLVGRSEDKGEFGAAILFGTEEVDFSRFEHTSKDHARLPCLLCHKRDDNSARMQFPGKVDHLPCASCHVQQFSDSSSPICTICHTNPSTGAMKRFPELKTFGMKFDHSRHLRVNCATCHRSSGSGAGRTIPSGTSAHTTCFRCHSPYSSDPLNSCNMCHQPGRLTRTPVISAAFRRSFSHSRHLTAKGMSCASCHSTRAGAPIRRQVTSPLTSMHFAPRGLLSCGGCHNGKRAFGADDFSNCRKCHRGNSFRF